MKYTLYDLLRLHEALTHINSKKEFTTGLCNQTEEYVRKHHSRSQARKTEELFNLLASDVMGFNVMGQAYWLYPLAPTGEFQKPRPKEEGGPCPKICYHHFPNTLAPARQKLVQEMLIEIEKRFHDGLHTPNTGNH